ncbi:hypothetical protein EDF59_11092 [Novosphingobium sp. ST904]|nr:hypothetical protein EDF59_11092 [Novosphingobium sp. ST904]
MSSPESKLVPAVMASIIAMATFVVWSGFSGLGA